MHGICHCTHSGLEAAPLRTSRLPLPLYSEPCPCRRTGKCVSFGRDRRGLAGSTRPVIQAGPFFGTRVAACPGYLRAAPENDGSGFEVCSAGFCFEAYGGGVTEHVTEHVPSRRESPGACSWHESGFMTPPPTRSELVHFTIFNQHLSSKDSGLQTLMNPMTRSRCHRARASLVATLLCLAFIPCLAGTSSSRRVPHI